jgi:hypothetical protein
MVPPNEIDPTQPDPGAPPADVTENEDGSVTVKTPLAPDEIPEDTYNLVPLYKGTEEGKKALKSIADKVTKDFDADWESCATWRKKRKDRWRLLVGDLDPKTFPFDDCANVHVPVMLERVLRVVHRLYAEMFPDRDFVFTAIPVNNLSQEKADLLTLDQNWQIRREITDFFKQNRRALMEFIANGDCIMHSSRDVANKRNRHETLSCEEVVFPYVWKTTAVDMSDVPRKARVLRKYKHEILELSRTKALDGSPLFADVDTLFERQKTPSFDDGPAETLRPVVDKYEGKERPTDGDAPYTFYEYNGWYKLPGQEDERPICATVEATTRTVVSLYFREQEDWKDRIRFDRETAEAQAYQQGMALHQQVIAKEQEVHARLAMPDVPPEEHQALAQTIAQGSPPPPQMPAWMQKSPVPLPLRKVPIENFSHGVCIENLDGSLGLGIGMLLEEFNKAANVAASQFTDSATLSNVATIIMPDSVKMEPGDKRLSPGEVHRVRGVSAEQIQNAFKVIQFPQANPQLLEIVKMSIEAADGVSSAPDVLSGEPGKANETYRGIATRVEQATKQLTVLALNYLEMLSNVLRNNARLNAVFMDDEEFKSVVDPRTLESKDIQVGRQLYAEDYEIVFTADTRFGGRQQKISEADQLVGMVGSLPPQLAQIMFPTSFVFEAIVRALKARGLHDMIQYLGPRPKTPQMRPEEQQQQPPGMPPGGPPGGPPPGGPPMPGAPQERIQGPPAPPRPQ